MAGHGRLTTHVLDTAHGRPAAGLAIALYREADGERSFLIEAVTNADGRCEGALLSGAGMQAGVYLLEFAVGDYFRAAGVASPFLDRVLVQFTIEAVDAHCHVPLLVSPFGYSTYRGS